MTRKAALCKKTKVNVSARFNEVFVQRMDRLSELAGYDCRSQFLFAAALKEMERLEAFYSAKPLAADLQPTEALPALPLPTRPPAARAEDDLSKVLFLPMAQLA